MPYFSDHSREQLETCHPDLQAVMQAAINFFNFRVLEGRRGKERQNELYAEGKSQLRYPNSNHNANPSNAVDIAPWPIDWSDTARFYYLAGYIMALSKAMNIPLRWGGDWDQDTEVTDQSFMDLGHFELEEQ